MLKVYIDDSQMGHPPVSVLGGWLDDSTKWAAFSDEWREALEMRPRVDYFKYNEAQTFSGQFLGWSERSRNERVRLLMSILARHKPMGIASAMPHDLYQSVFGTNEDQFIRFPYFFCFYAVVVAVSQYLGGRVG
jgi:hypothetical protein